MTTEVKELLRLAEHALELIQMGKPYDAADALEYLILLLDPRGEGDGWDEF